MPFNFFVFIRALISRTISANVSLTLMASLADVSTYGHAHACARASASSDDTCRWREASHLLPTRHMGTLSVPLTRSICSRTVRTSRNDCHEVRLKTMRKPRPFLMYRSRMEANCSVPSESETGSNASCPCIRLVAYRPCREFPSRQVRHPLRSLCGRSPRRARNRSTAAFVVRRLWSRVGNSSGMLVGDNVIVEVPREEGFLLCLLDFRRETNKRILD